jgi:hypothetical protein
MLTVFQMKMEVGCSAIEQFKQKMLLEEMQTIIGLKRVRLVKKGDKLECITYSDTIIEVNKNIKFHYLLIINFLS